MMLDLRKCFPVLYFVVQIGIEVIKCLQAIAVYKTRFAGYGCEG